MEGQHLNNVKSTKSSKHISTFRIALAPLMLWFFIDRNNPIFASWHPSWFDYFAGLIFVVASVTDFLMVLLQEVGIK